MRKIFITLTIILFSGNIFSQHPIIRPYLNSNKKGVKENLAQYLLFHNSYKGEIKETDSSVTLHAIFPSSLEVDFIFYFDTNGKCFAYKYTNCDTCVKHYFKSMLKNKKYKWRQVSNNRYISKYKEKAFLDVINEKNNFTIIVRRSDLSRKEHKKLYQKTA